MKLQIIITLYIIEKTLSNDSWPSLNPKDRTNIYDFIIVGSGGSGSVLANRLSENHQWKILLLEAGEEEAPLVQIPSASFITQFYQYNWDYFMEYQPNFGQGLEKYRTYRIKGKGLGGTSLINNLIYSRGSPHNYDKWASLGNPGWSYKDVLPYFKKSENCGLNNADFNYHGTKGWLSVEEPFRSKLSNAFIEGLSELGLKIFDYNSGRSSLGVSTLQATMLQGRKQSMARAFLHPIKHRSNLHIITSAHVTRVLINPKTKEAYGVEYTILKEKFTAIVHKEVILSAGTFNSPQLLMLAGIGPKKHLLELDIPIIQDLAVGRNLQDPVAFYGLSYLIPEVFKHHTLQTDGSPLRELQAVQEYYSNGTGPLRALGTMEAIAFVKKELLKDKGNVPDIELIFQSNSLAVDGGKFIWRGLNINEAVYNGTFKPIENTPGWSVIPVLLHPQSRGYMKLRSKDPYDYPFFYGNYFTDSNNQDILTLLHAIRIVQKLALTKIFSAYSSTINPNPIHGCEEYKFDSDDYWICALQSLTIPFHHPVGTCKMGPSNDTEAVVDHELRVYGVKKLRVADSSVIPFAISAHSNAPDAMIGEKAADLIKKTWNCHLE